MQEEGRQGKTWKKGSGCDRKKRGEGERKGREKRREWSGEEERRTERRTEGRGERGKGREWQETGQRGMEGSGGNQLGEGKGIEGKVRREAEVLEREWEGGEDTGTDKNRVGDEWGGGGDK